MAAGASLLDGTDLLTRRPAERGRPVGVGCAPIPQDPLIALDPSRRAGAQIADRLVDVLGWPRARELPAEVQVPDAERYLRA